MTVSFEISRFTSDRLWNERASVRIQRFCLPRARNAGNVWCAETRGGQVCKTVNLPAKYKQEKWKSAWPSAETSPSRSKRPSVYPPQLWPASLDLLPSCIHYQPLNSPHALMFVCNTANKWQTRPFRSHIWECHNHLLKSIHSMSSLFLH